MIYVHNLLIISMSSSAPRVTIARPSRSNGVLSIPASATQKKPGPPQEPQSSRGTTARLKIIIRRLPPGLTQIEFEGALGTKWRVGGGRVDWAVYKAGKLSKESVESLHERMNALNDVNLLKIVLQSLLDQVVLIST